MGCINCFEMDILTLILKHKSFPGINKLLFVIKTTWTPAFNIRDINIALLTFIVMQQYLESLCQELIKTCCFLSFL